MLHTEEQLENLGRLLRWMPWENEGMTLSKLDGFVAGLVCCPQRTPTREWLPWVWGDPHLPAFENTEIARAATDAVLGHSGRVAAALRDNPEDYRVVLAQNNAPGEAPWEVWVCGFELATQLRPIAWRRVDRSGDAQEALAALKGMYRQATGQGSSVTFCANEPEAAVGGLLSSLVRRLFTHTRDLNPSPHLPDPSNIVPFPRHLPAGD